MSIRMITVETVAIVLLLTICTLGQKNETTLPEIYGVRWALGQHYQFTVRNNPNNEYYVVIFNSDTPIQGQLFISISQTRFTCSSSFLTTKAVEDHHTDVNTNASKKGDIQETYLHKCIITNINDLPGLSTFKSVDYEILVGNLKISETKDKAKLNGYNVQVLFSGTFRLPIIEGRIDMFVIGDWAVLTHVGLDKGYNEVMPCIRKQIQQNENIRMLLFTGDMAYDLQGPHYRSMLNMIAEISSKMVFMVIPGNHDTLYHDDTFELFSQSFYTPQWRDYNSYFYTIKLGKLAIIGYNPELEVFQFKGADRIGKDMIDIFHKELTDQIVTKIQEQYFSIVFSHYPIYCSNIYDDDLNCDRNEERLIKYRQYFNKMNMSLYLAGHVHAYERSKPICFNGSFPDSNNYKVGSDCPVYIVEGTGGNDFYVQMDEQYPMKNYSAKVLYNTGFGVLSILSNQYTGETTNLTYQHIDGGKCEVKDEFVMVNTRLKSSPQISNSNDSINIIKIMAKTSAIVLGVIAVAVISVKVYLRYKDRNESRRQRNYDQNQNHVEMVQEQVQGPKYSDNGSNRESQE